MVDCGRRPDLHGGPHARSSTARCSRRRRNGRHVRDRFRGPGPFSTSCCPGGQAGGGDRDRRSGGVGRSRRQQGRHRRAASRGATPIDAAVAVASTLGVTEPFVAGPGGGGYMVIYLAKTHQVVTIDGREMCPAACTPQLSWTPRPASRWPFETARRSGLSVGVPGQLATWATAVAGTAGKSLAQTCSRRSRWPSGASRSAPTSSSRSRSRCRTCRPSPPAASCSSPRPASRCRSARRCATPTWPGPTSAGRARRPATCTTVRSAPRSPAPCSTRRWRRASPRVRPGMMTRAGPGQLPGQDPRAHARQLPRPGRLRHGAVVQRRDTVGEALNILSGWHLSTEPRARALFQYLEASRLAFADRNAYIGDSRLRAGAAERRCSTRPTPRPGAAWSRTPR